MTTRVWLIALPLVAVGWIGTLALVMRLAGAPAALVILPPEGEAQLARGNRISARVSFLRPTKYPRPAGY